MEIISEPVSITETVTDLDIMFAGGIQGFILREGDTYTVTADRITVETLDPPESIVINYVHVLWFSVRKRVHQIMDADAAMKHALKEWDNIQSQSSPKPSNSGA